MELIIASLNGVMKFEGIIADNLNKELKSLGLNPPVYIQHPEKLNEYFNESKDSNTLLFSNFPPDSSYAGKFVTEELQKDGKTIKRYWEADSYEKSTKLFKNITAKKSFKAIHFITGAPEEKASDDLIRNSVNGNPVTIKRKSEWLESEIPYSSLLKRYILDKIREQLEKNAD